MEKLILVFIQNVGASETILFRIVNLAQSGLFYLQTGKKKEHNDVIFCLTLYDCLKLGQIISPDVHTQV